MFCGIWNRKSSAPLTSALHKIHSRFVSLKLIFNHNAKIRVQNTKATLPEGHNPQVNDPGVL